MSAPHILVVEDDDNLRTVLADNLEEEGYSVAAAPSVAAARAHITTRAPDLIVLDIMLPDGDGYSLCRALRDEGFSGMVLMLTARALDDDLVRGLDAGADDYLKKPYRLTELLARLRALLRRAGRGDARPADDVAFGAVLVQRGARRVTVSGDEVALTPKEYELLDHLAANPGSALHRQDILDAVWGRDIVVDARTVDNFVSNLKRKLQWTEAAPWRIATVRGVGYRFEVG